MHIIHTTLLLLSLTFFSVYPMNKKIFKNKKKEVAILLHTEKVPITFDHEQLKDIKEDGLTVYIRDIPDNLKNHENLTCISFFKSNIVSNSFHELINILSLVLNNQNKNILVCLDKQYPYYKDMLTLLEKSGFIKEKSDQEKTNIKKNHLITQRLDTITKYVMFSSTIITALVALNYLRTKK